MRCRSRTDAASVTPASTARQAGRSDAWIETRVSARRRPGFLYRSQGKVQRKPKPTGARGFLGFVTPTAQRAVVRVRKSLRQTELRTAARFVRAGADYGAPSHSALERPTTSDLRNCQRPHSLESCFPAPYHTSRPISATIFGQHPAGDLRSAERRGQRPTPSAGGVGDAPSEGGGERGRGRERAGSGDPCRAQVRRDKPGGSLSCMSS